MSEIIADAIARTLRLDEDIAHVFADPPEGVHDFPTAIVLETSGDTNRAGYRGLWEIESETRVWLLVETRRDLEPNVNVTRPWEFRLLNLFAENDTFRDEEGTIFGEITRLRFRTGQLTYGDINHLGVELTINARVDIQVAVGCS
jgi:hypothetical protein